MRYERKKQKCKVYLCSQAKTVNDHNGRCRKSWKFRKVSDVVSCICVPKGKQLMTVMDDIERKDWKCRKVNEAGKEWKKAEMLRKTYLCTEEKIHNELNGFLFYVLAASALW